jgi:hypothetical protein
MHIRNVDNQEMQDALGSLSQKSKAAKAFPPAP